MLAPSVLRRSAASAMILENASDLEAGQFRGSRVVVIGAGAVGLYTANELARFGHNVVVIESGEVPLGSFGPETYESVGAHHEGIRLGRSRALGGTTNLWGGQLVEFQPVDFEGRDWIPGSKWPVTHDEIAPYYQRTYENLGIPREAQDDDHVWRGVQTPRTQLGEGLELFLTRWLKVPSFAVYYAKRIHAPTSPWVLLGHTAVGFQGASGSVNGVRVLDNEGRPHVVSGDQVILAAGTIETARLLLHSADASDWECPWRDNALVGRFFQDHIGGKIADVHPQDKRVFFDTFSNMVWSSHKYQPKWRFANEELGRARLLSTHGMVGFNSSISENLAYLKQFVKAAIYSRKVSGVRDFFVNLRACSRYLIPIMMRYVRDHRIFVPGNSTVSLQVQSEQLPLADSRVRIDRRALDANGMPRVILDWRLSGEELESIREFALRSDRALRAAGFARLQIDERLLNRDAQFLLTLKDQYHQVGGAIMGWTKRDGVVDRDLRVLGTRNLYVGGAATFRTCSAANTTLTALAFATRLVDHLRSRREAR